MSAPLPLRAPPEDGAVLAVPPLAEVGGLLEANRRLLGASPVDVGGLPLAELRRLAASEARIQAREYLRSANEPLPDYPDGPLLLAGHQPELFHPGVWVKNFALNGLACRHGLVPLNLIADNDVPKTKSLRFPAWEGSDPIGAHSVVVPYDRYPGVGSFEEQVVIDKPFFASFAERAEPLWRNWGFTPMLPEAWAEMLRHRFRTPLLGERFAAARRAFERRWGCHNLEVPLSRLCGTEAFARFALHLLADLPRFREVYNASLHEYRVANNLRSPSHPAPDLGRDGDWLEAPFRVHHGTESGRLPLPRRLPLWVRRDGDRLTLRAPDSDKPLLVADVANFVEAWQAAAAKGVKVRTRALTTTLFARLCLGESFIHGLGGGLYDRVTDAIIRRYFGIEPPEFVVLTATLRLPLPAFPTRPDDVRRAAREARDLYWNPQRHLPAGRNGGVRKLAEAKATLAAQEPANRRGRRERYRELRRLTEELRPVVAEELRAAEENVARRERELAANEVLLRRDYAWCLFPEALLRRYCEQFLRV